ncbi:MAG: hypothetical protein Q9173_003861 [Seirophora scorigena]
MSYSSSRSRKRSSTSRRSDLTTNTKSSPYNGDFEQKMIDSGIHPHNRASKPHNIYDIQEQIARPRTSLSPSQFDDRRFEEFTEACERAANEASAMADVIPIITGEGRKKYHSMTDARFTNMTPIVEDATAPKPDVYDGARPERIDPRVRHNVGGYIVPSKNTSQPAAPNFFFEGKSAGGRADVAKRQACYDGAVGARAMHSLQNYGVHDQEYDGNAYSYSNTFHNGTGTLQLYSTHPTRPHSPGGRPEYHMTQIKSYAMTSDRETFQKGATAFRNLRDLAGSHRDSLLEKANRAARHAPTPSPSTTLTESRESRSVLNEDRSDTSADELAAEELTRKRHRHGSSATRIAGISTSNVVPKFSSRHTMGGAGKSAHNMAPESGTPPSAPSRHTIAGDAKEPKRRHRLSQKLRDSEWDVAGNKGGEPRRRRYEIGPRLHGTEGDQSRPSEAKTSFCMLGGPELPVTPHKQLIG